MPVKNGTLFNISKLERNGNVITVALDVNKECDIFKGHFPGHAVVPGACMLQIVKEVLEEALGSSLKLKKAEYLKFINMIEPGNTPSVALDIAYKIVENGDISVVAKILNGEVVCFKFQGKFVKLAKN